MTESERTNLIAENRLGFFELSYAAIEAWPDLLQFMGQIVVVDARASYVGRAIQYLGYSPLFAPVPLGHEAPEYVVCFEEFVRPIPTPEEPARTYRAALPTRVVLKGVNQTVGVPTLGKQSSM